MRELAGILRGLCCQAWLWVGLAAPWVQAQENVHPDLQTLSLAGRPALVHVPKRLGAPGTRPLVLMLHGGLGNAQRLARGHYGQGMPVPALAEEGRFVVAYLNGTPLAARLGADKLGWNAGACCGLPAQQGVDDVAYVRAAVEALVQQWGIDRQRVFAVGHSNGAMMVQRVQCETGLFAAAVPIAGALESGARRCAAARGRRMLALHGAQDQNVPVEGGMGKGLARVAFNAQAQTQAVWQESGLDYQLQVIDGAEHGLESINAQVQRQEGQDLARKVVRYFQLIR